MLVHRLNICVFSFTLHAASTSRYRCVATHSLAFMNFDSLHTLFNGHFFSTERSTSTLNLNIAILILHITLWPFAPKYLQKRGQAEKGFECSRKNTWRASVRLDSEGTHETFWYWERGTFVNFALMKSRRKDGIQNWSGLQRFWIPNVDLEYRNASNSRRPCHSVDQNLVLCKIRQGNSQHLQWFAPWVKPLSYPQDNLALYFTGLETWSLAPTIKFWKQPLLFSWHLKNYKYT